MRALLIGFALLTGCGVVDVGPMPVQTNPDVVRSRGLCDLWEAGQPVTGTLEIEGAGGRAETWLLSDSGVRQHLAWPRGFSAQVHDGVVLDETGSIAFRRGDLIMLTQVSASDADGTPEDPYPVVGLVEHTCWIRR